MLLYDCQHFSKSTLIYQVAAVNRHRSNLTSAIRGKGEHGLLIKTLFQTGARVSEFVNLRVKDFFLEESMLLIQKGKGGKSSYVPILPDLAQELRTHLGARVTT